MKKFLSISMLSCGIMFNISVINARQIPFNEKELYRINELPAVMENLDYGLYQDGADNSDQKMFWQLQQFVHEVNNYMLLNVSAAPMYTTTRTTIEELVVALTTANSELIAKKFKELSLRAAGIEDALANAQYRCTKIQNEETLFIDPTVFTTTLSILEQAQRVDFKELAAAPQTTWTNAGKPTKIVTSELLLDTTKHALWIGDKDRPSPLPVASTFQSIFAKIYVHTPNTDKAKEAYLTGISLPNTFDGLSWRLVPPITELNSSILGYDRLRSEQEQDPGRKLPIHQMAAELQSLVAATRLLKEQLEQAQITKNDINRILLMLRKDIYQRIYNLHTAVIELNHELENKTHILSEELFIFDALADTSIFSLNKGTNPVTSEIFDKALQLDPQQKITETETTIQQIKDCSKIMYDTLQKERKIIYDNAGIKEQKKFMGEIKLTNDEQKKVATATTNIVRENTNIQNMALYKFIEELQKDKTIGQKLLGGLKEIPQDIRQHAARFLTGVKGLPRDIQKLFSRKSLINFSAERSKAAPDRQPSRSAWKKAETFLITAVVIIIVLAVIAGSVYLSCGIIAPAMGCPWWCGLIFSPFEMAIFGAITKKKKGFPQSQQDEIFVTPQNSSTALCLSFIEKSPEVTILWELSGILLDLIVTQKIMADPQATTPEQRTIIINIIQSTAWQHLTMVRKAIEKIKDKTAKAARSANLAAIRAELSAYFNTQRSAQSPA